MAQMPLDIKPFEDMKTHQKSSFVNVWEVLGFPPLNNTEQHALLFSFSWFASWQLEAFTLRQGVEICMVEASTHQFSDRVRFQKKLWKLKISLDNSRS